MAEFLELPLQLTKVWSDFAVKNEDDYREKTGYLNTITRSENARLVALNFSKIIVDWMVLHTAKVYLILD